MARKFCVMTIGRTGSTSLMESLERFADIALPNKNIACDDNELVHNRRLGEHIQRYSELCKKPVNNGQELIEAFYALNDASAYAGFKTMPNRHQDYEDFVQRMDIQFITLARRDVPSTAASFMLAYATGSWRRHGEPAPETCTFDSQRDGEQVASNVEYIHQSYAQLSMIPDAIHLYYEDLCNPEYASAELDAYFGRPVRFENPKPPTSGAKYVTNWEEFRDFVDKIWKKCSAASTAGKNAQAGGAGQRKIKNPVSTRRNAQVDIKNIQLEDADYANLESFCLFIGYPRSGHSLIGSLLDAHPQIVIANELDVLKYLGKGLSREQIFSLLIQNARRFAEEGSMSGKYSYAVPDQWQGRHRELRVIGDKKGGMTSMHLRRNPGLLENMQKLAGLPLKVIHIYRNPFDNIATLSKNETRTIPDAIQLYFSMTASVEAARKHLPDTAFYDLRQEMFIADPKRHIREMCAFLGQPAPQEYLDACAGIVYKSPHQSRADISWTPEQVAVIRKHMAEFPFLQSYLEENDIPAAAEKQPESRKRPRTSAAKSVDKTKRSKIMYVWELGMDLGHIMRFLPLGMKLRDRGYEVIFVIRELTSAESAIGKYGFPVLQAPLWLGGGACKKITRPVTLNYADIIIRYGFYDAQELKGLVKAWRQLYQYARPEMIIADHSPAALLAARTLGLKCATIGHGFFSPPHVSPTPNMRPWAEVPVEKLQQIDDVAVANANRVIADLGGQPLKMLSDLFSVEEEFITTFPELDHYTNRGKARYWGPGFNVDEGVALEWPEGKGPRIFAYLKPRYTDFEELLKVLSKMPAQVLAYMPGIQPKLREQYQSRKLHISDKPLKLSAILRGCNLVISHGGIGTVAATLLAGIPQLLLPTQLEQSLFSRRVVDLRAGLAVEVGTKPKLADAKPDGKTRDKKSADKPERQVPDYKKLLKALLNQDKYRQAAQAFAKKYARFSQKRQINLMASRVEEILKQH